MLRKLKVIAAGLFDLQGIEVKLASAITEVFVEEFNKLYGKEEEFDLDLFCFRFSYTFRERYSPKALCIGDLYPKSKKLFKDDEIEGEFRKIYISLPDKGAYLALSHETLGLKEVLKITLPANQLFKEVNTEEILTPEKNLNRPFIFSQIKGIVAHELRHAADFLFNEANKDKAGFEGDSYDPSISDTSVRETNYINNPTELKSWAGNLAEKMYRKSNGNPDFFLNSDNLRAVLETDRAWKYVKSENRKSFLQRAYTEFQKMITRGGYSESLPEKPFNDSYAVLRLHAKDYKSAKAFAEAMNPAYIRYREIVREAKEGGYTLDSFTLRDFKYEQDIYKRFRDAYKDLISGKNPESLPTNYIPDRFKF